MFKRRVLLFLLAGILIIGLSGCSKKFAITGIWYFYKNGSSEPIAYEFIGTAESGKVVLVGSNYGGGTYDISGNQIIVKTSMVHGSMWSRTTYTGQIDEDEERMAGAYSGQLGGNPVSDFSGTWVALKDRL